MPSCYSFCGYHLFFLTMILASLFFANRKVIRLKHDVKCHHLYYLDVPFPLKCTEFGGWTAPFSTISGTNTETHVARYTKRQVVQQLFGERLLGDTLPLRVFGRGEGWHSLSNRRLCDSQFDLFWVLYLSSQCLCWQYFFTLAKGLVAPGEAIEFILPL